MERPVSSTRGVRTTPLTEEEQRLENAVYSQLFGDAGEREEEDEDEDSSIAPADMFACTVSLTQRCRKKTKRS